MSCQVCDCVPCNCGKCDGCGNNLIDCGCDKNDDCGCDNNYVTGGGVAQVIGSVVAGVMFYPIIILCIIMIIVAMFFIMAGSYVKGITLAVMGAGSIAGIMFFIVKV